MKTNRFFATGARWAVTTLFTAIIGVLGPVSALDVHAAEAIYNEKADARADIARAVEQAREEHKHVLIMWGGNWCGWCHLLHGTLEGNEGVKTFLDEHYILVMVDSRSNRPLMADLEVEARSVPYLTVLDASGTKLTDQATEPLEEGRGHDPEAVMAFLQRYAPAAKAVSPVDSPAEASLSKALAILEDSDKRLFVKFSTESCGWCRRLDSFLMDPQVQPVLAKDYAFLDMDQGQLDGAIALRNRLAAKETQGVPWFAILDKDGKVLATATGPAGNIGYPAEPEGIDHFLKVLTQSRSSLSDDDLSLIEQKLRALGKQYGY